MVTKRQVFISSTAKDLEEFRSAAITKIERLDGWKCVNMERFGPRAGRTVDVCKKLVQDCDLFLGIVGHLYGSCPEGSTTSYTEHEYEAAVTANIPRVMLLAKEEVSVSAEERQVAFRKRVMNSGEIVGLFETPEELAADAAIAIANWVPAQRLVLSEAARQPTEGDPELSTEIAITTQTENFIFVCYKRENMSQIKPILLSLCASGCEVWYDKGIPGALEWDAAIEERIKNCKLFLLFLSQPSVDSKYVRREVRFADFCDKPILSVKLEQVTLAHGLDMLLQQYQMLDATDGDFLSEIRRALRFHGLVR